MIREAANKRINLTHHRVVARALRADPALIEEARGVVDAWSRGTPYPPLFVREWRRLLSSSAERSSTMRPMRNGFAEVRPSPSRRRGC